MLAYSQKDLDFICLFVCFGGVGGDGEFLCMGHQNGDFHLSETHHLKYDHERRQEHLTNAYLKLPVLLTVCSQS